MSTQLNVGDRVVVLGGSGFIGSHIIPALVEAGVHVVSYDLYPPEHPLPAGVEDVRGDIRDVAQLTEVLAGCDAVLNLAAAHHDFGLTPSTFASVNVDGARAVVAAMVATGVSNLCFYSSVAVYGDAGPRPDETSTPQPVNDYGRTKLEAEGVYREWQAGGEDRRLLVIRPAVVFGPRNYANVYRMIHQVARHRFLPVGKGSNRKSMIFVTNIVAAILHLWMRPALREVEIYNCVDQPDLTSAEILAEVYRGLVRRVPPWRVPLRPALIAAKPFDLIARLTGRNLPITSERIRKLADTETSFAADRVRETGYEQPVSLRAGLATMVKWYLEEGRHVTPVEHLPPETPHV
ncbi:NAD-dependent epimerase/dehydratase family protein [Pseudactinotalea suaedae]|uniref:NAD-dependent epimerase/dehydratase family protein n=1 Tax=Pseudactinotalea suaedae TaxID=1524924 RepID=UPI0013917026|nr:NAD-dependent epimerase/dehydratase family protein [Pseudactinotalea suaedae]